MEVVGEGRRGGQRGSVVQGKPAGARSASSTNPQPGLPRSTNKLSRKLSSDSRRASQPAWRCSSRGERFPTEVLAVEARLSNWRLSHSWQHLTRRTCAQAARPHLHCRAYFRGQIFQSLLSYSGGSSAPVFWISDAALTPRPFAILNTAPSVGMCSPRSIFPM